MAEPIPRPAGEPQTDPAGEPATTPAATPTTTPKTAPTSNSAREHGRIVVGVDGSKPSLKALRWAGRQAVLTGADLEAVMAWETPGAYGWADLPDVPGLPRHSDVDELAAQALSEAIGATLPPGQAATVTQIVMMGHPAQVILERGEGADLVVVGVRGHGTFHSTLLGSVSHTVALHASCPVVVVRGEAEQAD